MNTLQNRTLSFNDEMFGHVKNVSRQSRILTDETDKTNLNLCLING